MSARTRFHRVRALAMLIVGAAPKRLAVGVVSTSEPAALEGGDPR